MRQKVILLVLFGIILSIMGLLFMNASKASGARPHSENPPKYIEAIRAEPDTIQLNVEAYGKVMSEHSIPLSVEVQGELMRGDVPIKNGSSFKKGDVLFQIKSDDIQFSIKARRANFIQIFASALADLKIDYANSFSTWVAFFNDIDIDQELPSLPSKISQKEKTFLASRGVLTEYYSIKAEEARIRKYRVIAPFDGTMIDVQFEEGSRVNPGTRVVTINQPGALEVVLPVSADEIAFVKKGATVELKNENINIEGTVKRISQNVDPSTQSINVYVNIPNNSDTEINLFDGMYLSASIHGSPVTSVIEVPRRALVQDHFVYVIEDSLLVMRTIEVVKNNRNTAIINGVNQGDWVVVESLTSVGSSKYLPLE